MIDRKREVSSWIHQHAHSVSSGITDPSRELRPLFDVLDGVEVVGIGTTTRKSHELMLQQSSIFRALVEGWGFRSLILEEDYTRCVELDNAVSDDSHDIARLLVDFRPFWSTVEMLDLVQWIQDWNTKYPESRIRISGLNSDATGQSAYSEIGAFLEGLNTPDSRKVATLLRFLAPGPDVSDRIAELSRISIGERRGFAAAARDLRRIFSELPGFCATSSLARSLHAVVDFYEYHSRSRQEILEYAAERMADNVLWWKATSELRAVYFGGIAHTSVGHARIISHPPVAQRNTGSFLRERLGSGYLSVGLTFHHGQLDELIPAPKEGFVEALLGESLGQALLLNFTGGIPLPLAFESTMKIRSMGPDYQAANDPDFYMTGGAPRQWFDILIHTGKVGKSTAIKSSNHRAW
ncbi:erythromycin esterase family protein [Parafrankia sp. FMc6]|uniref:erythromycin esterase family protein n=1 Tax=Parafrankia soli TaxID=2599596 RepID=UPI0034D5E1E5